MVADFNKTVQKRGQSTWKKGTTKLYQNCSIVSVYGGMEWWTSNGTEWVVMAIQVVMC